MAYCERILSTALLQRSAFSVSGRPKGKSMTARFTTWIAVLLLLACGPSTRDVERLLAAAKQKGPGTRVSLAQVAPEATRLFIFGPYTSIAQARHCLGPFAPDLLKGLESRDDINVIVFRMADGRLKSVAVLRAFGDFVPEAIGRSYALEQAEFVVGRSAEWSVLAPVGDVPTCM